MTEPYSSPDPAARKPVEPVPGEPLARVKPSKPYPEFPLYSHPAGYWAKKIRGRLHYFGRWEDPDGALDKYLEQKDDLHAGRTPRPAHEALTVKDAVNAFLNEKKARAEAGELGERTWEQYKQATDLIIGAFGKPRRVADLGPEDFSALRKKMAQRWGPVRLGNVIQSVRSVFKFAFEAGLIDRPVRYGPSFKKPSAKVVRLHRAKQGAKLFTAAEIRRMIDGAGQPLMAMILLGINAGLGNTDCGRLPLSALDLESGWMTFPRVKTGVQRRCWLWPETVAAIKESLRHRPEPANAEAAKLVFITRKFRIGWERDASVTHETMKLLKRLGINGRKGLGFYTLRHVFRTVADEVKDQPAIDHIMGHVDDSMSGHYRERIDDRRLKAVSEHVKGWLFREEANNQTAEGPNILKMEGFRVGG
jgi:integrase